MPQHIPTDKYIAEKARQFIHSNLSLVQPVTDFAAECGVTPYTLKRIFKELTSESVADYSLRVRMEKAIKLLVSTNNTLQMIAEAVGYTEGNNFQNIFKRTVGVPPGNWRKKGGIN